MLDAKMVLKTYFFIKIFCLLYRSFVSYIYMYYFICIIYHIYVNVNVYVYIYYIYICIYIHVMYICTYILCIYIYICNVRIFCIYIHIHVFLPSQDSSVWLGLTSREQLMSPECSKHQVLSFAKMRISVLQSAQWINSERIYCINSDL